MSLSGPHSSLLLPTLPCQPRLESDTLNCRRRSTGGPARFVPDVPDRDEHSVRIAPQADAHKLPFEAGSFDAVVGNFLILHLGRPEQAVAGFVRMLRPGGRLALTAWDVPERARFLGVFLDAVADAGATAPEDLPKGPDFFRFSVDEEFDALMRDHGLEQRAVESIAFTHRVANADELWEGLLGGTVRTSALIERQPDETRRRIRDSFDRLVREYQREDVLELPPPIIEFLQDLTRDPPPPRAAWNPQHLLPYP